MESAFLDGIESNGNHESQNRHGFRPSGGTGDGVHDILADMNEEDRKTIRALQRGARIVVARPLRALTELAACMALAAWTVALGSEQVNATVMAIPSWVRIIVCAAAGLEMLYRGWAAFLFFRLSSMLRKAGEETYSIRALTAMYTFETFACVFLIMFFAFGPSAPLAGLLEA